MLTPIQIEQRTGKLTASRVACLMTGDVQAIMDLWREMVGDPDYVPEDLSGVWPVQLGSFTEPLNLDWYERKFGPVSRRGEVITHPSGWAAATLDGWDDTRGCPVETKHCGGREALPILVDRYQPQMQWQMIVTNAQQCALSVIMGANEPIVEFVDEAPAYQAELWRRAEAFMACVNTLTPPAGVAPVAPPVKPEATYDMTGQNEWAAHAATWLENVTAKKVAETAEKELKALVPADALKCHGHGIIIGRDRAGRLALREDV